MSGPDRATYLFSRIRRDLHALERHFQDERGAVKTGWRRVRGTHGDSYVEDPDGTDRLPEDMEAEV